VRVHAGRLLHQAGSGAPKQEQPAGEAVPSPLPREDGYMTPVVASPVGARHCLALRS